MSKINFLYIFNKFDCETEGNLSETALDFIQELGLIPREGTYLCPRGHLLKLIKNAGVTDGYLWR